MAVEVNNFSPYIIQADASNADQAVFHRHFAPYIIAAPSANADESVFLNNSSAYELFGRDTPNDSSLRFTALYQIIAPAENVHRPQLQEGRVYVLTGGRAPSPKINAAGTTMYLIYN